MRPQTRDRRVEALVHIEDPRLRARIDEILRVNLADDNLAWDLHADGTWRRVERIEGFDTHLQLQELALKRATGA